MKRYGVISLLLLVGLSGATLLGHWADYRGLSKAVSAKALAAEAARNLSPAVRTRVVRSYGELPLRFEVNQGQTDSQVRFRARSNGFALFLTDREAVLALSPGKQTPAATLRMKLVGARPAAHIAGVNELPGKSNYFIGNDPRRWRAGVSSYGGVKYSSIYPGIDLLYYGNQQQLEFDFVVAPGADPGQICLTFAGAQAMRIAANGELILHTRAGEVRQRAPELYQEINGQRRVVRGRYVRRGKRGIGFAVGAYDRARPLVIDPVLLYASYVGGTRFDSGLDVAVDSDGNTYLAGQTTSPDFPNTGSLQTLGGDEFGDAFVLKLNPSGSALVYATYLGGDREDAGTSLAVDASGQVHVAGYTFSSNFPLTPGALQAERKGDADAFVTKLNANGTALLYSTLLGGENTEIARGIALDATGNAYVAGVTESFTLPANGVQNTFGGHAVYKSFNRAGAWSRNGKGLNSPVINDLVFAPNNTSVMYAATQDGVFKSTDGGLNWVYAATNRTPNLSLVAALAVDPSNPNIVYAVTQFGFVFKSVNGGQSWELKNTGLDGVFSGLAILIDPASPNTLYLGTNNGVYKSSNGAGNWTPVNNGLRVMPGFPVPRVNRLLLHPTNSSTIYAATEQGVFISSNAAGSWTVSNNGFGGALPVRALAFDPTNPQRLYAGASGVFKSTDGGATWVAHNNGLIPTGQTIAALVRALAIDPTAPTTLYAVTARDGVYKSTDGGLSWSAANSGLNNSIVNTILVEPTNPSNMFLGVTARGDGFAAKLNANGTALAWLTYLGGAEPDDARGIAVDQDGNAYVVGSTSSRNFPLASALQTVNGGGSDAFIAKLNPQGTALVYSSYLGGAADDFGFGVALSQTRQVVITGTTSSANFPTVNPLQAAIGGAADAFIAQLNPAGAALEYSTWLGGARDEQGFSVALDNAGNAHVTGLTDSTNFPVREAVQAQSGGRNDAFVAALNANGSALLHSTYFGGSGDERANAIAVDKLGQVYIAGTTNSQNLPTLNPLQAAFRGNNDAFLAKLSGNSELEITKVAASNPALVNQPLSYTISVINRGPLSSGVTVTDPLPANTTFVSATPSQGTCANNAGTVVCNLGSLAVGATAKVTLVLTPTATGTLINTARVTSNEGGVSFSATATTTISNLPSIRGQVTDTAGNGLADIPVRLGALNPRTTRTDGSGFYQFTELPRGAGYTVNPEDEGYSFEPPFRTFEALTTDQTVNFTATTCTYSVTPATHSFGASGGGGTLTVTAPPRCRWSVQRSDTWIAVNGIDGVGNGTVGFFVSDTTKPRSGFLMVGRAAEQARSVIYQGVNACATPNFRTRFYSGPAPWQTVDSADFNGDSLDDLLLIGYDGINHSAQVLYGAANGRPSYSAPLNFSAAELQNFSLTADFNDDGKADFLTAHVPGAFAQLFLNNGNGSFASPKTIRAVPLNEAGAPVGYFAANLNSDHLPELIGVDGGGALILLNSGAGGFAPAVRLPLSNRFVLDVADVNGDGLSDLVTGSSQLESQNPTLRVYLGGGGGFPRQVSQALPGLLDFATVADVNGDRAPDLIALLQVNTEQGLKSRAAVLPGNLSGNFGAPLIFTGQSFNVLTPAPLGQRRLLVRDFNNDARPDLLLAADDKLWLLPGDGTGRFTRSLELGDAAIGIFKASTGVFDGSGNAGFVTLDTFGFIARLYANTCGVTAPAIFGYVREPVLPRGIANVTIKLGGPRTTSVQTDVGGNYEFGGLTARANYTVTPESDAHTFTPPTQSFNNLTGDARGDFTAVRGAVAVSAASFSNTAIAPASIAAVFGIGLSSQTETARALPLPTVLANTEVQLTDVTGKLHICPLFFVSPGQINLAVPAGVAPGAARIRVYSPFNTSFPESTGTVQIATVAPGLFSADASGHGLAAAVVLRIKADGTQVFEPVTRFDPMQSRLVAVPIELSNAAEQVFLLLFGTGFRNFALSPTSTPVALIGGLGAEILYAGAQGSLIGLDQVNLRLPRNLAGRGEVEVLLSFGDKTANSVRINVK